MEAVSKKTTKKDRELAKSSLALFEEAQKLSSANGLTEITFRGTLDTVKIPQKAMNLFADIISRMAQGHTLKLVDLHDQIGTQEAADYLQVSRPYVVKLLEQGKIPYTMVGTHRRVFQSDVELYAKKLRDNRHKQLEFLAKQAQELQLGYE